MTRETARDLLVIAALAAGAAVLTGAGSLAWLAWRLDHDAFGEEAA